MFRILIFHCTADRTPESLLPPLKVQIFFNKLKIKGRLNLAVLLERLGSQELKTFLTFFIFCVFFIYIVGSK